MRQISCCRVLAVSPAEAWRSVQIACVAITCLNLAGGCSSGDSVVAQKSLASLRKQHPDHRFALLSGGEASINTALTELYVNTVKVDVRDGRGEVEVGYKNMTSHDVAPKVFVSLYNEGGQPLGRFDVVNHTLRDLGPSASGSTKDQVSTSSGTVVIVGVDDDPDARKAEAIEAEKKAKADAAEQAALAAEEMVRGRKPKESEWDGITPEANTYLKNNLNDYGSMELVNCSPVAPYGTDAWAQRVRIRAKNGFGAKILRDVYFVIRDGQVVSVSGL